MTDRVIVNFTPTGKPVTHGGSGSAYANYGCRCELCIEANTARVDRRRRERQTEEQPANLPHGRDSTYSNWGCRCEPCKAAYSLKNRRAYEARKVGGKK